MQDTNQNKNFPAYCIGELMKNSDKGETLLSKTVDLEYSTKQVNKMHYLYAQNTEI